MFLNVSSFWKGILTIQMIKKEANATCLSINEFLRSQLIRSIDRVFSFAIARSRKKEKERDICVLVIDSDLDVQLVLVHASTLLLPILSRAALPYVCNTVEYVSKKEHEATKQSLFFVICLVKNTCLCHLHLVLCVKHELDMIQARVPRQTDTKHTARTLLRNRSNPWRTQRRGRLILLQRVWVVETVLQRL